jgi:DNA-binding transcriptional LysR family regulator
MNFSHLKYFYDAALEKNLAKAAAKNFVTQSAISLAIRKLEDALDCELLVHKKNSFQITEEGLAVFRKCQDIFQSVENLKNEVKQTQKEISGQLNFATSHSIALSLLPDFLKRFKKKYPLVVPGFRIGRTAITKKLLESGEVDFAITVDDGTLQKFDRSVLMKGTFVGISSNGRMLNDDSFILTESRPETEQLKKHFQKEQKRPLPVFMEVESWDLIYQFAQKGLGIGYVPDFVMRPGKEAQRIRSQSIHESRYELCFLQTKGRSLSRAADAFYQELKEFLEGSQ